MKRGTNSRRAPRQVAIPAAPRVYGDSERFRGFVTRQIAGGEHLLDELEGARRNAVELSMKKRVPAAEKDAITLMGYYRLSQWTQRAGRWRRSVLETAERQLADQSEALLPHLSKGVPPPGSGLSGGQRQYLGPS